MSLFICRLGIPLSRKFANTGIGIKRCKTGLLRKTSSSELFTNCVKSRIKSGKAVGGGQSNEEGEEQEEQLKLEEEDWISSSSDSETEGSSYLVTTLQTSGRKVKAVVDTGSGVSFIHQHLAPVTLPLRNPVHVLGINTEETRIIGEATISVQIKKGIRIPLKGLVVEGFQFSILLGTDFLLQYNAKIRIPKGTMELSTDRTKVKVPIKLQDLGPYMFAVDIDPGSFTTPLTVTAWLNGRKTEVPIDTGAAMSIIREDYVAPGKIRPLNTELKHYTIDHKEVKYSGETDIEFTIEGVSFSTTTLIAQFDLIYNFVLGNSFSRQFVELIDFEQQRVTFILPGIGWVTTPMTITKWVYQLAQNEDLRM